jgi:hypothetical protein
VSIDDLGMNGLRLIADTTHDLVHEALDNLTPEQREMFKRCYGIGENGETCERSTVSAEARRTGNHRKTAQNQLLRARAAVFEHIATRQLEEIERRLAVLIGETSEVIQQHDLADLRHMTVQAPPRNGITLGEGSEAAVVAGKHQRSGAYEQVHRKHAR